MQYITSLTLIPKVLVVKQNMTTTKQINTPMVSTIFRKKTQFQVACNQSKTIILPYLVQKWHLHFQDF